MNRNSDKIEFGHSQLDIKQHMVPKVGDKMVLRLLFRLPDIAAKSKLRTSQVEFVDNKFIDNTVKGENIE